MKSDFRPSSHHYFFPSLAFLNQQLSSTIHKLKSTLPQTAQKFQSTTKTTSNQYSAPSFKMSGVGLTVPKLLRESINILPHFSRTSSISSYLLASKLHHSLILISIAITGTWAAPFSLYYALLSWRVVSERLKSDHYIGDRPPTSTYEPGYDPLEIASRCQGNL